jgi:hypothetical protein
VLLLRVRDHDDDLIRDKVRVSAPSHHEELTLVVRVVNGPTISALAPVEPNIACATSME